jgi:hypothetical protein
MHSFLGKGKRAKEFLVELQFLLIDGISKFGQLFLAYWVCKVCLCRYEKNEESHA